jgi:hypothetical protein
MVEDNSLDLENIKEKQDEDNNLQQSLTKHPTWYSCKNINDINDILCYTKPGDNAANWKIVLPKDLIVCTIRWYHQVTGHPRRKRLYQHISMILQLSFLQTCWQLQVHLFPKKYIRWQGIWIPTWTRSPFDTIWGMCYGSYRTLDRSSPWEPVQIWSALSNRHWDQSSRTHQNWWQKVKNCCKKICAMLANALSVASALCTWPWYRIHRTRIPNAVTKFPYQRCVHYCKNPQFNAVCE